MNAIEKLNLIAFAIGIISLFVLAEPLVKLLMRVIPNLNDVKKPKSIDKSIWEKLFGSDDISRFMGAKYIGRVELVIFYFAFVTGLYEAIGAWLAFKVASKWETWNNIIKVNGLGNKKETDLEYLKIRVIWGVRTMDRFLLGTALNLFGAFGGAVIYYLLSTYCF